MTYFWSGESSNLDTLGSFITWPGTITLPGPPLTSTMTKLSSTSLQSLKCLQRSSPQSSPPYLYTYWVPLTQLPFQVSELKFLLMISWRLKGVLKFTPENWGQIIPSFWQKLGIEFVIKIRGIQKSQLLIRLKTLATHRKIQHYQNLGQRWDQINLKISTFRSLLTIFQHSFYMKASYNTWVNLPYLEVWKSAHRTTNLGSLEHTFFRGLKLANLAVLWSCSQTADFGSLMTSFQHF